MTKKKYFLLPAFLLLQQISIAQNGGNSIFPFLNLPTSSRVNGMGGMVNNIYDDDVNLGFQNPALFNEAMNNQVSFSPVLYLADSKYGFAGYSHSFHKKNLKPIGSFGIGVQYLNYGKFSETDMVGNSIGEFKAFDEAFILGYSRKYNEKLSYGLNAKYVNSLYDRYTASAFAFDLGGNYFDFKRELSVGVVLKNFGLAYNNFTSTSKEKMPFDIEAGISKKLKHTPFLFSINLHHLQKFNIRYDDPNDIQQVILGDTTTQRINHHTVDKIMRHAIFAAEISIGKNLRIDIGYNNLRRQELSVSTRKGLTGFCIGATIKVNRFNIGYSRSSFSVVDGVNHFTLGINLGEYISKKKKN